MDYLIYFIIILASIAISEYTRPVPEDARPAGLGDFDINTADASRRIPVLWGRPSYKAPNVVWHGGLRAVPVSKEIDGLFFDDSYKVGYQYFLGIHFVLCMGSDDAVLEKIWIGDQLAWEHPTGVGEGVYPLHKFSMFGGIELGTGGVYGDFSVKPGYPGQGVDTYLQSVLGPLVPEYNKVFSVIARDMYLGTSTQLKMWEFQVKRLPNGLGTGHHNIDNEANPAEILYECLVDLDWGMGLPDTYIDKPTFVEAAETLYDEGMGISMVWDQGMQMDSLIKNILKHIDAVMYVNALTGMFELKLMRKPTQTELDNMPVIDNTKSKRTSYSRPGLDELVNEVKIIFTDVDQRNDKMVHAQELGLYEAQDKQIVSTEIQYKGFTKPELALRCAERDLRLLSYPLAKVTLEKVHREFYTLSPGDKFKYTDPELEIYDMVMAVIDIDYGSFRKGELRIEAVQDVFTLGETSYNSPPDPSLWEPPNTEAEAIVDEYTTSMPYWFQKLNPDLQLTGDSVGDQDKIRRRSFHKPLICAKDPTGASLGYNLRYSEDAGVTWFDEANPRRMTPVGVLEYDYGRSRPVDDDVSGRHQDMVIRAFDLPNEGTTLESLVNDSAIENNARNLVIVNGEIMGIKSLQYVYNSSGTLIRATEVWRGLTDTPKQHLHPAGSIVYFVSLGSGTTNKEFFYGITDPDIDLPPYGVPTDLYLKLSTIALNGALELNDTPTIVNPNDGRAYAPHAPSNIRINGQASGDETFVGESDDILIQWNHRSRWLQGGEKETDVVPQPVDPNEVPLANTSDWHYEVLIYDAAGTLKHTENPVVGTSYLFTKALEDSLAFDYDGALKIVLRTYRTDTYTTTGGPYDDLVPSYFDAEVYIHRDKPPPVGDYADMLGSSLPVGIWGFEE